MKELISHPKVGQCPKKYLFLSKKDYAREKEFNSLKSTLFLMYFEYGCTVFMLERYCELKLIYENFIDLTCFQTSYNKLPEANLNNQGTR